MAGIQIATPFTEIAYEEASLFGVGVELECGENIGSAGIDTWPVCLCGGVGTLVFGLI